MFTTLQAFKLFDTNGEDGLDEEELDAAVLAMGFASAGQDKFLTSALMQKLDRDKNNKISYAEFKELMQGHLTSRHPELEIRATFRALCQCKDGPTPSGISLDMLRKKSRELKLEITDEELQSMFKDADANGDGKVELQEYEWILKNSVWM